MQERDMNDAIRYANTLVSDLFPPRSIYAKDVSGLMVGTYRGIPVMSIPRIKKIYFNNKHTTIEWSDGVKTTVGCIEGQEFDEYGGFTAALAKRLFGSSSAAIRFMNEHKEVQPEPVKKAKKASNEETTETAVTQDA